MVQKQLDLEIQPIDDTKQEKDLYGIDIEMSLQSVNFATTENPYFYENFIDEENEKE
ncbi:hypothetical protein [Bacillus tuaregi]|uniref:hypothetical protein n=1 Tax=Bacillus tuaregi TaxID=1816695 RepID=UPI001356688A|nr:hypothetical protein [Bacillus tuaregi]